MWQSIRYVFKKELIHTLRDKKMRFMMFVAPVLQLIVFGYAATFDVKNITLYVDDQDATSFSRQVKEKFVSSGYFREVKIEDCLDNCEKAALDQGKAMATLVIPDGFEKKRARGEPAEVQLLIDGTNSNSATIMQNYTEIIVAGMNQEGARIKIKGTRPDIRFWYNEELEAKNFMVPAVFAMVLFILTIVLTSMALTRERELGTYEQLLVSPIDPKALILGKTIPFAFMGLVQITIILIAAWAVFDVVVKGSLFLFYISSLVFLLTSLGIGIFISSLCQTMQQAMMTSFIFLFPVMILSGMMFPIDNMPTIVRWITLANPLRYFVEIVRGIFLKSASVDFIMPRLLILLLFGVFSMAFAARGFRKTLS